MKTILITALFGVIISGATFADEDKKQAINFCPLGVPAYGLYAVNYEFLLANIHGFNLRLDYAPLSDNNIDITDKAVILNYRWYMNGSFDSMFAGIYTRYRENTGSGIKSATYFEYDTKEQTLGLNIGKRWLWKSGLNAVVLVGYGVSHYNETVSQTNSNINSALDAFKDDNDLFFDNPFFGEFSIGYAF